MCAALEACPPPESSALEAESRFLGWRFCCSCSAQVKAINSIRFHVNRAAIGTFLAWPARLPRAPPLGWRGRREAGAALAAAQFGGQILPLGHNDESAGVNPFEAGGSGGGGGTCWPCSGRRFMASAGRRIAPAELSQSKLSPMATDQFPRFSVAAAGAATARRAQSRARSLKHEHEAPSSGSSFSSLCCAARRDAGTASVVSAMTPRRRWGPALFSPQRQPRLGRQLANRKCPPARPQAERRPVNGCIGRTHLVRAA